MSRLLRGLLAAPLTLLVLLAGCDFDGAYDLPLPGSPVDADESYEVTAEFADILNVVPRSPVYVDDVTVGEVTEVERDGWHAVITMRIRDDVALPANAVAEIRQVSLLGEKYVALEAPTDEEPTGTLADGDRLTLESTGRNPEVEEVLAALSFLLSGGGVGQLGTITRELNAVMDGRTEQLSSLLGSLDRVVGTLDDQKADVIRALEALNNLTATLNAEKQTVTDAIDAIGPAVDVLAAQHDELVGMLTSLDRLGRVGTRVIEASKADLLRSLAYLEPVLKRLNQAGDSLAPGLNLLVSFPFPKEASEIVKGDYANTQAVFDISLRNLFPGGVVPPIDLPDPGELVGGVVKCLRSGDLTSKACTKVLDDLDLLKQLKQTCQKKKWQDNPVCQVLALVPGTPDLEDLPGILEDLLDDLLPGGGLPGGGLLGRSLRSGRSDPTPALADVLAGGAP